MTAQDIETSLRSLGIGWDPVSRGLIQEDPATATCNPTACSSYARIGTDAGVTAENLALAIYSAEFEGEPESLAAILADAKDARTP